MKEKLISLRKDNEVLDIFCKLVQVPSPSLKEEKVIEWIKAFCEKNSINYRQDDYGNIYITVPATDETKEPIMVSAHMDVVGDDSPIELQFDGQFIKANERTLGADDKVGVACGLMLAKEVVSKNLTPSPALPLGEGDNDFIYSHGGLEITFTRDEETGMSGAENLEFDKMSSKYVLVCDADKLGQLQVSGASYTNAKITVKSFKGGHSGIDIGDETRLNAAKLITELLAEFPQGAYYKDETGVITSCNLGAVIAGGVQNSVASIVEKGIKTNDYITEIMKKTSTNIINVLGMASYSIRSASVAKENELKALMQSIVDKFNQKYEGLAKTEIEFEVHLLPFERVEDDRVEKAFALGAKNAEVNFEISSFHAGAETHIYCQKQNSKGETFAPFLLGLADIYNMHSAEERVDYNTILKGYEILKNTFIEFNK